MQKKKIFTPKQHLKIKFYTSKQKQILATLARIKKINAILDIKLFELSLKQEQKIPKKIIANLRKKIIRNKIEIKKINAFYNFFLLSTKKVSVKKKKHRYLKRIAFDRLQRQKLNLFWKLLKKKFNSFGRAHFLKQQLPLLLVNINKNIFKPTFQQNCSFSKKKPYF